ncbi:MAG: ribonuclease R [Nitrospinae bacterium RIFCSPLOWO2_12_39_16]|nr:MAG: ribonuclease R [Nitrospinae bacterium RIFCSPLOWO2_12_39_16]HBA26864.1 ribonuclease R [Nitrospinota bacterium]
MKITNQEILKFMRESVYRPLTMKELIKNFNISSENRSSFRTLIRGLASDGEIIKIKGNRFGLPEKMNLVTGVVQGHPDGYGFVIPEDGGEDLFINPRSMREVMHGDKVICRAESAQKGGKKEGRIIRILERGHKTIVGIYEPSGHFGFVIPDDRRISHDIYIPFKYSGKAKKGHAVITEITAYPMKNRNPEGRIIEIIGYPDNPDVEIDIVLRKYDIPSKFPIDVLKEADAVQKEVTDDEITGRLDLRDKNIVTIDGEKAKDFDDAVYVERLNNGNYMLGVHIADVSHYVKEGNTLDNEAFKRGTSVYFPDRVIPMLPFQLSNEICSLKPKVDRLTLSALMEFDKYGELIDYRFDETVINSKERMTYTDVAEILNEVQSSKLKVSSMELKERYSYLLKDFYLMRELCEVLREKRMRRGSIDFDLPEPYIILDLMGKPENIIKAERNIAHKIIEEFMLVANETVAMHFMKQEIPALYRVHDEPDQSKIIELSEFVSNFGYHLKIPVFKKGIESKFHPKRFQELLNSIRGKPEELLISTITLRHMKQARYSPENIGHFGLAFENYTHFTSPIRRYPDLIVHRLLKEIIKKKHIPKKRLDIWEERLPKIAQHSSEKERTADAAENDIVELKRVQFMLEKIGDEYEGIISGVTSFGLFVELKEIFVEGLIHVSSMADDYYALNERDHSLIGRRTKKRFRMGDRVKVKVENVSIEKRQIDFVQVK